jgi:hypothetical protein
MQIITLIIHQQEALHYFVHYCFQQLKFNTKNVMIKSWGLRCKRNLRRHWQDINRESTLQG